MLLKSGLVLWYSYFECSCLSVLVYVSTWRANHVGGSAHFCDIPWADLRLVCELKQHEHCFIEQPCDVLSVQFHAMAKDS